MAPAKRVKTAAKSSTVPQTSDALTPATKSSKSRRNLLGTTASPAARSSAAVQSDESKDLKTPARSVLGEYDIFSLLCHTKSTKKTNSSKTNGKKTPKTPLNHSCKALADILKDDEPVTSGNANKSYIDGVFDKWMEQDPHATLDRFMPGGEPGSPDRPLTLFSPMKDDTRTFSVPQVRSRARRALGSPIGKSREHVHDRTGDWSLPSVSSARKEMLLGATPLFRKQLGPSAYSPCNSNKNHSRLNRSMWSCDNESVLYSPGTPSCSTPLDNNFKTPTASVSRPLPFTGEPLSGVKALFHNKYGNGGTDSPNSVASTPALPSGETPSTLGCGTPARPAFNSSIGYTYSAMNTPDGVKSTALFGVTCYVEVRYNKEDRSEWIRKEVASHGAKVEKNFTKKVTHVVFKEGKISTYMKAKELNIPVVSLLWIDACKTVGGLVDPALYPPSDDDKFQREIPLEEARKRQRFLRRGQAFLDRLNGILPPKPPRSRTKKKPEPSATEGKRKKKATAPQTKKTTKATQPNKGPKKLNFNNPGPSRCVDKKATDSDSDYVSETDSEENALRDQKRRKSAPADLGEAKQQKLTRFFTKETKEEKGEDLLRTPPRPSDEAVPHGDLLKILTGGYVTTDKKRRRLFDPNQSMSFSQQVPGTPAEMSPYIKVSPPSKRSRSRTTSSKRSKRVQEAKRPLAARKSLAPLMEHEEQVTDSGSPSGGTSRNSMACFELEKKSKVPVKSSPRIAFTSVSKDDISNCKGIIKKLGSFEIDSTVTKRTTHLLTSAPARRTVNLLKAIARGCWILDVEWLVYSESNGKWMSEEPFEIKSFSEAVAACRMEKQAFGKDFSLDLFSKCGSVFVDSDVQPPRSDLVELLKLCSGKVVHVSTSADVVVSRRPATDSSPGVPIVSPLWILDSITQNKSLPLDGYKI